MMRNKHSLVTFVFVAMTLLVFGTNCSDDEGGLGSTCGNDGDCDGICATGHDFPGGICTYFCYDNRDCPDHWVCADKAGGTCLETCTSSDRCKDLYDSQWHCKSVSLRPSGKAAVCIGS